ncbi:hypothetical protein HanRHA438_Chr04g0150901 [Helianthus annuus]|nr:hypothetical protein HanRHA438_Chr04g0150901 [Helianthus annuus]
MYFLCALSITLTYLCALSITLTYLFNCVYFLLILPNNNIYMNINRASVWT